MTRFLEERCRWGDGGELPLAALCLLREMPGDPPRRVPVPSSGRPVPAARREREKPREAREDTSSSGGSEVTSWPLIPPARCIWVSGEAQLRAMSLPSLSLEIHL